MRDRGTRQQALRATRPALLTLLVLAALLVLPRPAVTTALAAHHLASSRHDPTSSIRAQAAKRASTDRGEVAEPQGRKPRGRRAWGQPKERDQAGRVVREKTFEGREIRYQYDARGRLHRLEHADGTWREFRYNDGAQLLAEDTHGDETVTTQFQRDQHGRVVAKVQQGQRITYTRDVEGFPLERVLPNGARTRYAYDATGALSARLARFI